MKQIHKLLLTGLLALAALLLAGLGSYALAQSDGNDNPATGTQSDSQGGGVSRHVDYNVSLQVSGDLSAVDPKLAGVLPLNLSATGGADIEKNGDNPSVQGNLQLGGFDAIVQKLAAQGGANNGQAALGAGMIGGFLSDIQFVAIDKDIYVKLGDTWYDTGGMTKPHDNKPDDGNGNTGAGNDRACAESAFPGGPKALLKDVKTVEQENIDGVSTTHTAATVDIDKALTEAAAAATSCGKADETGKIEAAKAQITGAVKTVSLDWWTDGDGQLRQAKAAVEVNPSTLAPLAAQLPAENPAGKHGGSANVQANSAKVQAALSGITSVKLDATVKFSRFGEDFQISKPDGDIKPLKDLMGGFGGGCKRGQSGESQGNSDSTNWHRGNRSAIT